MHRMQSGGWPYSKSVETPRKHRLFVQLSFVRRSYVAIVIDDRHVLLLVRKRVRAGVRIQRRWRYRKY